MRQSVSLLDVLDRILDKGVVVIGDIKVSLCDVELLSIKLKLLITSIETAEKMGIDFGWAGMKREESERRMMASHVKTPRKRATYPDLR